MRCKLKSILVFDIGGTKISSGIVEVEKNSYRIHSYQKTKTPKNKDEVIQEIIEQAVYYREGSEFDTIGISVTGQVDCNKGVVYNAPNIKDFDNVNLEKIIFEATGLKTRIENDAKCFALAENKFGRSRERSNVVYLVIGTGIGGAIEIDNKLYRGVSNTAGEFGHMVIVAQGRKCKCGNSGCFEQYVSGKAIERLYYESYGKKKKAKYIALDSVNGVEVDKNIIKQASFYLSIGLSNIINTINPEIVVVGGSVVKQKEIIELAVETVKKKIIVPKGETKIVRSDLEDEAFLVGAALLE